MGRAIVGEARALVLYSAGRDLAGWHERHTRGEGPDAWPYGLNHLSEHFGAVSARTFAADSTARRAARRLLASAPLARRRGGPVVYTWDENSAARMAFSWGVSARYCGVVWLTDAVGHKDPRALEPTRRALRGMEGVWVLSAAQVEPLRDYLGPDGPPVHHVLFGIDETFFAARPYPERPMVVSVGGDRDRDAQTLFESLELIHAERPDAEIVVQSTSTAPPPEGVRVVPYLTHAQLRDLYARASVAVIATRDNSHVSGMTVGLEVMATGRPIVITETAGMADYFTADGGAALVPLGDAAALGTRALELLEDPQSAARAGEAARRRVESAFTTRHLASRLAALAKPPA